MESPAAADARAFEARADQVLVVGADARLLFASAGLGPVFGEPVDAQLGRPILEALRAGSLAEEDRKELERGFASALRDDTRTAIALRLPRSDSDWQVFEGRIYGPMPATGNWVFAFHDVTTRWLELADRLEREGRFRTIADASLDMVTESDAAGRFTYVSPATCEVLGYDIDELVRQSPLRIHHPEDVAGFLEDVFAQQEPDRPFSVRPHRLRRRDGSWVWVEATGVRYRRPDGEVRLIGVARDITRRLEAAAELRSLEEQVRHAQKLESLGVLAGGIAHDFNNLLTPIVGSADMLASELADDPQLRKSAATIQLAADRATALTAQMLAYAGKSEPRLESVDVSAVVEGMRLLLEATVSQQARFDLELERGAPPIRAERGQIEQVVMNLVTNAVESLGPGGGTVALRTATVEADAQTLRGYMLGEQRAPGPYIAIEVRDDGEGIDPETREQIFDPFYSTKFTGRGLGLSVVLGIVRSHAGALRIESERGGGTTFRILLPVGSSETAASRASAPPASPDPWQGVGVILVVDDDPGAREVTAALLERAGFDVRRACGGLEALEIHRNHVGEIRALVLDSAMPDMSGAEVFDAIRAVDPDLPVVFTSGYTRERISANLFDSGSVCFLQKPFRAVELIAAVGQVIEPKA